MKKFVFSVLVAGLLSVGAFAQEKSGLYVGAGLGLEAVVKDADNGFGLALKGGIKLDQLLKNLGAEVELGKSLSDPKIGPANIDVLTLAGYVTYDIKFGNSPISARPKFGVVLPNLGDEIHSRDFALSTGIAGVLKINNDLNAYLDYTNVSEFMNTYTVGVEFSF